MHSSDQLALCESEKSMIGLKAVFGIFFGNLHSPVAGINVQCSKYLVSKTRNDTSFTPGMGYESRLAIALSLRWSTQIQSVP